MSDAVVPSNVNEFYDDLAGTYDLLYPDWETSMVRQAKAIDKLIRGHLAEGVIECLDCACGIGTQLIGLAGLGYIMSGSDLSAGAIARARDECAKRGVVAPLQQADMRALPYGDSLFDAVVCADNSLPHLLSEKDVLEALSEMLRVVRVDGVVVITTRDYDRLLEERPEVTPIQRSHIDSLRVVSTQLWDWRPGSNVYDLTHLQVQESPAGKWEVTPRIATYRAWSRAELRAMALQVGLRDVRWFMPEESNFFQPVMIARH